MRYSSLLAVIDTNVTSMYDRAPVALNVVEGSMIRAEVMISATTQMNRFAVMDQVCYSIAQY